MRFIKIKLTGSKENKDNGYYLLITNGPTWSDAIDEFVVEESSLDVLRAEKIKYERITLIEGFATSRSADSVAKLPRRDRTGI